MVEHIKQLKIITLKYKNTYVFPSIDDIVLFLDENLNHLIFMKSSPFIKTILKKANDLENRSLFFISELS
jgi:hypothetical protein